MMGALLRWTFPLLLVLLGSCANIVPPTGGDKDVTPPKLLRVTPPDSQRNSRTGKIVLEFDEYVTLSDAASQVQISPLLSLPLTVTAANKHVTITIPDSLLQEETTYRITFGTAIRDLHEGNVYPGKGYLFSTGAHFDSLSLAGTVYNAHNGLRDSVAQVLLYSALESDSAVVRHKPLYVTHVDVSGNFLFQGLPPRPFRVYALHDANSNLTFDGGSEWIGFYDQVVTPDTGKHEIVLRTFPEALSDTAAAQDHNAQGVRLIAGGASSPKSLAPGSYVVGVDTTDPKRRTQDIDMPMRISFGRRPAVSPKAGRIFLSYDSAGTTIEVPFNIETADTSRLRYNIVTHWQQDALYTLRLQKGFAQDSTGADMLPGRFTFRTKRDEDYGKIRIHLPTRFYGRNHILQVVSDHDTVYQKPVTDTMVSLMYLRPGVYSLRMIEDKNENGRWDAGNLFLQRQPELVIPYNQSVNLKAGWEQQIDFDEDKRRKTDFSGR
jgi:hypothetical protein